MATTIDTSEDVKIHKDKAIYIATYFGGPLAGGYMIAENFKSFGDKQKYRRIIILSIAFTIVLFTVLMLLPDSVNVPRFVIPVFYTLIAYWIVIAYQQKKIDSHIGQEGKTYSGWRAVLISVISLAIMTFLMFVAIPFLAPEPAVEIYYQPNKTITHQILYDPSNIGKKEVGKLGQILVNVNYFDTITKCALYVSKADDTLKLEFPLLYPDQAGATEFFRQVQGMLQPYYPKYRVEVIMSDSLYHAKHVLR